MGLETAAIHESLRDPLTGLFHGRYFVASLEREVHRMERRNLTLGVILLEIDGWAGLAESHGQDTATTVLRTLAELLQRRIRGGDVATRNRGGEFGLILPGAPLEGAQSRAEQIRTAVKDLRARTGAPPLPSMTLSLGVAAFPDHGLSSEKILRAARAALEQSKAGGCDCVTAAPGAALDRRLMLPD